MSNVIEKINLKNAPLGRIRMDLGFLRLSEPGGHPVPYRPTETLGKERCFLRGDVFGLQEDLVVGIITPQLTMREFYHLVA